jgi:FkbM family methyltransferase
MLKRFLARLPDKWQAELKRIHFSNQIRRNTFEPDEPEYDLLSQLISNGDWVIDIGANVGHYTKRFSELAGPQGRVFAFEPIPATFSLLAANSQLFAYSNTTLINAAISNQMAVATMSMPTFASGLKNYYRASLEPGHSNSDEGLDVLTLSVDSFGIDNPISLIKIDAEGHEKLVIEGVRQTITRYSPTLIVETHSKELIAELESLGYLAKILPGSPNVLFLPRQKTELVGI